MKQFRCLRWSNYDNLCLLEEEEEEEVNIIMLQLGPILYLLSYTERGHTVWDVIQSNEHRIYSRLTCGY